MTTCAAPGCDNDVERRHPRGRPPLYCSRSCRRRRIPDLVVELDHEQPAEGTRPVGRVWRVQLRRGERIVVLAERLGWASARTFADEITEMITASGTKRVTTR